MIPFLKFWNLLRWYNKLMKYTKIHILMVSPILCITSKVKHTKKHNSIDSESKLSETKR